MLRKEELQNLSQESRERLVHGWVDRALRERLRSMLAMTSELKQFEERLLELPPYSEAVTTAAIELLQEMTSALAELLSLRPEESHRLDDPTRIQLGATLSLQAALSLYKTALPDAEVAAAMSLRCGMVAAFAGRAGEEAMTQQNELRAGSGK